MFIATLFIIVKKCKQHKYPSTGKWIKNMAVSIKGILFVHKRERSIDTCCNRKKFWHIMECAKPDTKGHML